MRKKILSYVLGAAVIAFVAMGSSFARDINEASSVGMSAGSNGVLVQNAGVVIDFNSLPDNVGRISQTFNYVNGVLVATKDGDRNINIFSDGKLRASFGYNSGTYSLTNVNLTNADWSKIDSMKGSTDGEKLKNYLLSLGFTEAQLTANNDNNKATEASAINSIWQYLISVSSTSAYKKAARNEFALLNFIKSNKSKIGYTDEEYKKFSSYLTENVKSSLAKDNFVAIPKIIDSKLSPVGGVKPIDAKLGPITVQPIAKDDGKKSLADVLKDKLSSTKKELAAIDKKWDGKDVAWLATAAAHLKKGQNYSISINVTAALGATMTTIINGQADKTYSAQTNAKTGGATVIEEYVYHHGFLSKIETLQYQYVTKDGKLYDANEKGQGKGTANLTASKSVTYMDQYGRASKTVNADGSTASTYKYSSNGSLSSVKDKDGNTSYYVNGRVSFVNNASGYTTTEYSYNANGTLNGVKSKYDSSGKTTNVGKDKTTTTQTTAYSYGKAVATSDKDVSFDKIREVYGQITAAKTQEEITDLMKSINMKNISLYAEHASNTALMNTIFGKTDADVTKAKNYFANMTNGYSSIASVDIDLTTQKTTSSKTTVQYLNKNGKPVKSLNLKKDGMHTGKKVTTTVETETTTETMSFKITVMDRGGAAFTMEGNKCVLSKEESSKTKTDKKDVKYSDPAVIGTAESFTDADGNEISAEDAAAKIAAGEAVYVKVDPKSVNMLDGSGFNDVSAKEGEEIFVKIEDEDMFKAFSNAVGTGEQVMVMGLVTSDIDGKLTMDVYNTANGKDVGFAMDSTNDKGYAVGNVDAVKAEVEKLAGQEGSWVDKNTKINQAVFAGQGFATDAGYIKDWKDGWQQAWRLLAGNTK